MDGLYFSAMASGPAEWISAIGQIVAAAGTLAAVVIALWLARLDGRRIRAELADRDAGQAREAAKLRMREDVFAADGHDAIQERRG